MIISIGVNPAKLDLPGVDLKNIYLMCGFDWAEKINGAQYAENIKNVAVIGAGNGIAAAEVMAKAGKNVTLIDTDSKPLENYLNDVYTDEFENELRKNGVNLAMNTKVEGFSGDDKVERLRQAMVKLPLTVLLSLLVLRQIRIG